jgi:hypothetical protein
VKKGLVVFIWALIIVLIAELIGRITIPIGKVGSITLLPLLYAVIMGLLVVTVGKRFIPFVKKSFTDEHIAIAGKIFVITLIPLGLRLGTMVGSQIKTLFEVGPALIIQSFGSIGTLVLGFPIAMLLGIKREAIGATISICREPTLGVMTDKYKADSPEFIGTMSIYIIGIVFGTIIMSILGSLSVLTPLHPYALAMGSGIGSASMMTAAASSISAQIPAEMKDQFMSIAAASNLLGNIFEAFFVLYITLPLANFFYKKFEKNGVKNV